VCVTVGDADQEREGGAAAVGRHRREHRGDRPQRPAFAVGRWLLRPPQRVWRQLLDCGGRDEEVPLPRHLYGDRNSGLTEIYLYISDIELPYLLMTLRSRYGKNVTSDLGIPKVLSEDQSGIAAAVAMCAAADTCVLAVGSDLSWAAEGHDARNISYTTAQQALVTQAAAAAKKPIIVVTLTAVPLDLTPFISNPKVGRCHHPRSTDRTPRSTDKRLCGCHPEGRCHHPRGSALGHRARPGRGDVQGGRDLALWQDDPDHLPFLLPGPDLDLRLRDAARCGVRCVLLGGPF
jgi:hypothetical protein